MRPVLVVEDDVETRQILIDALRGAGFDVLASDEGRKALELATAVKPGAIVLDLMMHGMDGWEFLDRRKEVPALASTPVIVITATPRPRVEPAVTVMTKPFDLKDLLAAVRRAVKV